MKLTHIRVKDFRSFAGEHDFDVSAGVSYVVGPNNCGKSNLVRALELALDPDASYSPERDRPVSQANVGAPPLTRITLTFDVGSSSTEKTLLKRAEDYEFAVRKTRGAITNDKAHTYASLRELRFVTTFGKGGARQSTFQTKGAGAAYLPVESDEHRRLERQFRSVVRFAVVHSGEDLESLLKGKFREILQLVISDHLEEEQAKAEAARQDYLETLQTELLNPLRTRILERVGGMFPEISLAELRPNVPTLDETLSSVDVRLGDAITTELSDKGTGVRGAVLVSMLQYLAEQSKRSLVLAVEEPEAFLHPAGQEIIKTQLENLAERLDVSLVVTTHSPHVISHSPDALVTELRKDGLGCTSKGEVVAGDQPLASLLAPLYRDGGLAAVVQRSLEIPDQTKVVVVTEGYTDGLFISLCCSAAGRDDLLDGLQFLPAHRAANVVPQAIITQAATSLPVIALLDSDDNGKAALEKLKSFDWNPNTSLLSLNKWPGRCNKGHDVEIEDLLPQDVVQLLVDEMGQVQALDGMTKCGDGFHLQLSMAWKEVAIATLGSRLKSDPGGMAWLAQELQDRGQKLVAQKVQAAKHVKG